jgi:hypothetical protein
MYIETLEYMGGQFSTATAIIESGHVVGESETLTLIRCTTNEFGTFCEYERHPFLFQDGQMLDLGMECPLFFGRPAGSDYA